jgi:hypothetical protein
MNFCIQIDPSDNTAVLLGDAHQGESVTILGKSSQQVVETNESIAYTHKIAIKKIPKGTAVIKYGISIGHATQDINIGDWIHLHNLASDYDERSSTLELHSGLSTDMSYE